MIRLGYIRAFDAIYRGGSVSEASRLLNLSQPAVTKSITQLEHLLDVRLFDRHRRGLTPTPAGHLFSLRCRRILHELEECADEISDYANGRTGQVKFGCGLIFTTAYVPEVMTEMSRENDNIRLSIIHGLKNELVPLLMNGEIEFIVSDITGLEPNGELNVEHLMDVPMHIVASRKHLLSYKECVLQEDLKGYQWIHFDTKHSSVSDVKYFPQITTTSVLTLASILADSDMLSIVADTYLEPLYKLDIDRLPSVEPVEVLRTGIVHRKGFELSPVSCEMIARIKKKVQEEQL